MLLFTFLPRIVSKPMGNAPKLETQKAVLKKLLRRVVNSCLDSRDILLNKRGDLFNKEIALFQDRPLERLIQTQSKVDSCLNLF